MKKPLLFSLSACLMAGTLAWSGQTLAQTELPPTRENAAPVEKTRVAQDINSMLHNMPASPMNIDLSERVGVKTSFSYQFPETVTEGKRMKVRFELENAKYLPAATFPIKGTISFPDQPYDLSSHLTRSYAFEIPASGVVDVPLLFYTPGKKEVKINSDSSHVPPANLLVDVKPFKASIFPQSVDTSQFDQNPEHWNIYVNLRYAGGATPQRQYYMVTYKNEIIQRLLTSAARPGYRTPQGNFKLGTKMASPRSTKYQSVMPFWSTIKIPGMTFEYGNHGLLGESYLYSLGAPASHGCVRLSNKSFRVNGVWTNIGGAKWVYSHVPLNTPIQIFNRQAPQPFAYENYRMWLARNR